MKKHLYIFGYCTPEQIEAHEKSGWDDEDSQALFIIAGSEPQALEWGESVSEKFIQDLFEDSSVSWKAMKFARWIESNPEAAYTQEDLSNVETVAVGEYPAWEVS